MSANPRHLATRCAHGGTSRRGQDEANAPFQHPIVQSTIFNLGTSDEAEAIFSGAGKGYAYSRFGNPSVDALAEMLAEIEGGAGALVTSSGNAAILCAVTAGLEGRNGHWLLIMTSTEEASNCCASSPPFTVCRSRSLIPAIRKHGWAPCRGREQYYWK